MAFSKEYYEDKKQKLIAKAQQLQQKYLNDAFVFTGEVNSIQLELNEIAEWEKENIKEEVKPTPKGK